MSLSIVPLFWSRRAVSDGGSLLSVADDLTCFIMFFERVWIEDRSRIDRVWIEDGSRMDRVWIEDGSSMDRGWIEDGSRMDRGWIEDGWFCWSVGCLAEQPPTPPLLPVEEKSHRDCPRKKTD